MTKNSIIPNKSLGQHWLTDPDALQAIARVASIDKDDVVLEVGPGLGTLTEVLVRQAKKVVAVEFDKDLAEALQKSFKADNLEVINADILDFDLSSLPKNYKVVANIPYYLTSHLIRNLLEADNKPSIMALLVQKEVAQRIVAGSGNMSILSVASQFYAECSVGIEIAAELFDPPPKVDSQVVILKTMIHPQVDKKLFFRIVKAGFGEKRKKLVNSLAGGLQLDKKKVQKIIKELGFESNVRAQELSVEDWVSIYEVLTHES